jgi:hypothetical protein
MPRYEQESKYMNFETFTIVADSANDFAGMMARNLVKSGFKCVDIGEFYPILINHALHYTFTIKWNG